MHISTRIQRCWALLAAAGAATDEEFPKLLKPWIAGDLAGVSSRLEAKVASSRVMQFILKTHASEVPLDRAALLKLRSAASSPVATADQEKFFHFAESLLHDVVCPEYDTCCQCQSRRYLLISNDSNSLCIECECCGCVWSMETGQRMDRGPDSIPTRSQLRMADRDR
jgi:hypothetical protein